MDTLAIVGLVLIVYGALVIYVAIKKPKAIWEMGKIQGFVKVLGEIGTVIFFCIWAVAAAGLGIYFLIR